MEEVYSILFISYKTIYVRGGTVINVVSSWLNYRLGACFMCLYVLHVSVWAVSIYFGFLPQSKDMSIRLIGGYKLPLVRCVSSVRLATCPECIPPTSCLVTAEIGSSNPTTLIRIY